MNWVITFLASYSNIESSAANSFFDTLRNMGFFSYLLPFLIIFSLVFVILNSSPFFENKMKPVINAIISLSVGLIAIQFPAVSQFFSVIFPKLGIALAIILVIIIVLGLFIDKETLKKGWMKYLLIGIAAVIIVVILVQSSNNLSLPIWQWFVQNWASIVAMLIIIGLIVAVIVGSVKNNPATG